MNQFILFSRFDNIIFDLDGTLIDSAPSILNCLKKTLSIAHLKTNVSFLNCDLIGPTIVTILQNLCPTETTEKISYAVSVFRKTYDDCPFADCSVFPEAIHLLQQLRQEKKSLFMATNKPKKPTESLLSHLPLGSFEAVFTPDIHEGKILSKTTALELLIKQLNLNKQKTVMVGDTVSDMISAKEAGIKSIAVLWGYEKNKELLHTCADFIFEGMSDD